ncbi:MAG: SsrA-binding protein [Chlamydiae bacterium RIFCSPHIGHO2_12_FULL_49_9]|nr:MAG: SsrA-binding protein [Chlamydiae bacterium RIFCSPHIGHO2_12_FULL_49_9]
MAKTPDPELVSNRRAGHDYEILETFEAGIVLVGTEIKSLRNHGGSLQDAYVDVRGPELILLNSSIAPYSFGNIHNHEERRPRKLLMHKREIEKLRRQVLEKGLTVIPLSIFLTKKGIAKVKIAIAKGKKAHDKRESLKEKEAKRSIRRALDE